MANDLAPDPRFDFSHYRPGDVLILDDRKVKGLESARQFSSIHDAICKAAERAGLGWTSTWDQAKAEIRIEFIALEAPPKITAADIRADFAAQGRAPPSDAQCEVRALLANQMMEQDRQDDQDSIAGRGKYASSGPGFLSGGHMVPARRVGKTASTYASLNLRWPDGTPLQVGDTKAGETIVFDRATGIISSPGKPK